MATPTRIYHINLEGIPYLVRAAHPSAALMARNSVHQYGPVIASIAQLRGAINRQINKRIKEANA